jgi:hypothetical protein
MSSGAAIWGYGSRRRDAGSRIRRSRTGAGTARRRGPWTPRRLGGAWWSREGRRGARRAKRDGGADQRRGRAQRLDLAPGQRDVGRAGAVERPARPQKRCRRGPVSRVLYPGRVLPGATVISLGRRLPGASSGLTRALRAGHPMALLFGLAPGGVYRAGAVTRAAGELLPHRFTLTGPRGGPAVCFLWHCPWGRPPWVLPSTLPCGARTFLPSPPGDRRPPGPLRHAPSIAPRRASRPSGIGSGMGRAAT